MTIVFYSLNSLFKGATYKKEDGVKCLYLNGKGAHARTPPVDFGQTSLTMTSWVKLQSPVKSLSTIYGYWKEPYHFLFDAYSHTKLRFIVRNSDEESQGFALREG